MDWLHFVGKVYYTREQFIEEAQEFGVSRRVSVSVLKSMNWGDRVYLAQGDMRKKTRTTEFRGSEIFGSFIVSKLGLTPQALAVVGRELSLRQERWRGVEIVRGCGRYVISAVYRVKNPLTDIAKILSDLANPGVILVQGRFLPLVPPAILKDVSFQWGFRRFDGDTFREVYRQALAQGISPIVLGGEFRVDPDKSRRKPRAPEVLRLYQIDNYIPKV